MMPRARFIGWLAVTVLLAYTGRAGWFGWILFAAWVLAGRLLWLKFQPYRDCRWCQGTGRRGVRTGNLRGHTCWRCNGHRLVRKIGAKQVAQVELYLRKCWAERTWRVVRR